MPAIGVGHIFVQRAVLVEDVDQRKVVALADFEVVEVVTRRDLHRAGAFLRIGVLVGDDRNRAMRERQHHILADQILVARIVGMDRDGRVAEHRLRPRRRDGDEASWLVFDRIVDVPEVPLHLDVLDLEIADRGLQPRIPVHQTLVLVDQALAMQLDERLEDGAREALVHREALARPIGRSAEAAKLLDDRAAGLVLPLPDRFEEFLAAHRDAALLALGKLPLDDELRRDAGMIGARPARARPCRACARSAPECPARCC